LIGEVRQFETEARMPRGERTDVSNAERALRFDEEMEGSRRRLRTRALQELAEYVAGAREWGVYGTLTYDQRRLEGRASFWKMRRDVLGWCRDTQRELGRPVVAMFGFEAQKNGWPHAHGLMDVGGLAMGDIATLGRLWFRRAGGNKLLVPDERIELVRYCCKYVLKDENVGFELFGRWEQLRWALPLRSVGRG